MKKTGQAKMWRDTLKYHSYKGELASTTKRKAKRTGGYYQAEDLMKRALVSQGWQPW